jgi:hypothetical protein
MKEKSLKKKKIFLILKPPSSLANKIEYINIKIIKKIKIK